ncbi:hypothetical protein COT48_00625 [Candidatus Woesearchaeota archaeon CG08_land_8_20_14_0_20_47_9]|nr:MAG: hypothetical protein AUJ69_01610 [Candidatus Woesearchaeota archaeon CG1_02_47_18]PIN73132.1 MAG: hypothetical protein COV22_01535 [Candidatus Woesearchaeota archaeon CG10_big_fil_rev_8_21_14_0_10_47_5]PIO04400.1 MAG: hypothetical protein COT48_00625 [Candidatus Woesearchaeota archaeon CG08_land_8_20_14_0_20_47_9]HII29888.1 hypothetical protein [Candidatus Woesearchaeota archaeon]
MADMTGQEQDIRERIGVIYSTDHYGNYKVFEVEKSELIRKDLIFSNSSGGKDIYDKKLGLAVAVGFNYRGIKRGVHVSFVKYYWRLSEKEISEIKGLEGIITSLKKELEEMGLMV